MHKQVMKKLLPLLVFFLGLAAFLLGVPANLLAVGSQKPYHLVVLGDPHLPGKFLAEKEALLRTINSWADVKLVVAVGDICEDLGTAKEYAAAQRFFSRLVKPLILIPGNHDYIYADIKRPDGKRIKGTAAARRKKLSVFKNKFGMPAIYQTKLAGKYQLIFLATDDLQSGQLARISRKQLAWRRIWRLEAAVRAHIHRLCFRPDHQCPGAFGSGPQTHDARTDRISAHCGSSCRDCLEAERNISRG